MENSKTMNAVVVFKSGGPEVLRYEEVDRPLPEEGEVLVKIHAVGINAADLRGRSGFIDLPVAYRPNILRPSIPGFDISGEVVALGKNAKGYKLGDEVYGMMKFPPQDYKVAARAYAGYTSAIVGHLAPKPISLSHVQAAAVPMAALTAWQQVYENDLIQAGQNVLIIGAAGGVGHFAVQFAKLKGAYVTGVASTKHKAFLFGIGTDDYVDYTQTDLATLAADYDVIIDCVGGPKSVMLLDLLKKGGIMNPINIGFYPPDKIMERQITVKVKQAYSSGDNLRIINQFLDANKIQIGIDSVFDLENVFDAHQHAEQGHLQGKVVLKVAH